MATTVSSYSKINLGLAIGAPRPDGFHSLATLYQTLALHDLLTVTAKPAALSRITLTSNDPRVPLDQRNTAWKVVEKMLQAVDLQAEVQVHIQKNLPIQGGMGAGSANAAAALLGLERELALELPREVKLSIAAEVGSDVPLFLIGGSVLGSDRGQRVRPVADVTLDGTAQIPCVVALPQRGVSTPLAFREWDRRFVPNGAAPDLHNPPLRDTLKELSRTYASVFPAGNTHSMSGTSGIFPDPRFVASAEVSSVSPKSSPAIFEGSSRESKHQAEPLRFMPGTSGAKIDLAENSLLALVRTGIENDFESVVFLQYPLLGEIKRQLMGASDAGNAAVYSALSGSGSALFGLYRCQADATAAQQRLQQHGVQAIVTTTLPRPLYWSNMFAE